VDVGPCKLSLWFWPIINHIYIAGQRGAIRTKHHDVCVRRNDGEAKLSRADRINDDGIPRVSGTGFGTFAPSRVMAGDAVCYGKEHAAKQP